MKNIAELISGRRSVRTYDGRELDSDIKEKLSAFMKEIKTPFDIPVTFKFLNAGEHGLVCPVVSGTQLYIGGKVKNVPNASVAFGYAFEMLVLYAQSLGLGTVWLGGTMNRAAYEAAMELEAEEIMPCATPIGFAAKKMSVRESMMRKAVKADERIPFETLFFKGGFDAPLAAEEAGTVQLPLEMVRLAPSAVNKQPWRVVVCDDLVHFYLKRGKGFSHSDKLDMQMIDMGIAMCHFALTGEELGLKIKLVQQAPSLSADGLEYIATYCCLP